MMSFGQAHLLSCLRANQADKKEQSRIEDLDTVLFLILDSASTRVHVLLRLLLQLGLGLQLLGRGLFIILVLLGRGLGLGSALASGLLARSRSASLLATLRSSGVTALSGRTCTVLAAQFLKMLPVARENSMVSSV